jgi:hypothetical protein
MRSCPTAARRRKTKAAWSFGRTTAPRPSNVGRPPRADPAPRRGYRRRVSRQGLRPPLRN